MGSADLPGHRHYDLPGERVLEVRAVTPADADGLAALYGGLSDDDLHNRFFSLYRPEVPSPSASPAWRDRVGTGSSPS